MKPLKVKVLMYHDIVSTNNPNASGFPGKGAATYKLTPEVFQSHLAAIAKKVKMSPITFDELDKRPSTDFTWLITFDDGGKGAYMQAAEILECHGWHGHFFITTDYIDQPAFLTEQQIRELRIRGHFIGSHSCSHPERIASCSYQDILAEWRNSVALLSDILGEQVNVASVPGGFYAKHVTQAAAQAGIKVLFTSEPTLRTNLIDGCLVIGRYTIKQNTTPSAAALASGQTALCWSQWLYWNSKKAFKVVLGKRYQQIQDKLWRMMRRDVLK